jgi:hypothetical protein
MGLAQLTAENDTRGADTSALNGNKEAKRFDDLESMTGDQRLSDSGLLRYPDACIPPNAPEVIPLAKGIGMRFVLRDKDAAASRNARTALYCRYEVVGARGLIDFQYLWSADSGATPTVSGFNPLCEYGPKVLRGIGTTDVYVGGGVGGKKATARILPVGSISLRWDDIERSVVLSAENTLDYIRPLAATCDGYIAGAEEPPDLRSSGTSSPEAAAEDSRPPVTEQPDIVGPECKLVEADTSSTLYGSGAYEGGGVREQCLCGLEVVDRSRCQ